MLLDRLTGKTITHIIQDEIEMSKEAAEHMSEVLKCLGFDLSDQNYKDTPARFVKYLQEYMNDDDPAKVLVTGFDNGDRTDDYKGMIAQTNIPFRTVCPHHLLPVMGRAHLGYIPNGKVVGLSKLTRVVHIVGTQLPRMQEAITDILVDLLWKNLDPKGTIVVISAEHMCMAGRGIAARGVPTVTSSVRGIFRDVPAARDEFFRLIQLPNL